VIGRRLVSSAMATTAAMATVGCASLAGIDSLDPAVDGQNGGAFCAAAARPTSPDGLFFCDDFDQGSPPSPWTNLYQTSGTLTQNSGAAESPPNSLDIAVGPLALNQPVDASLRASLGVPPLPAALEFSFGLDPVRIDTTAAASIVLAAIDFLDAAQNRYTVQLAFDVQNGAPTTVLDELYSDGTPYIPHPIAGPLTLGAFTDIAIQIHWASAMNATADVLMHGAIVLSLPLTIGVDATSLQISIGTTFSSEPSSGWEVRYDNVLFSTF
jgi:hypothetical protein